jgi:hypothetical protein
MQVKDVEALHAAQRRTSHAAVELRQRFVSLEQRYLVLAAELFDEIRRCAAGIARRPRDDGVGQQRYLRNSHAPAPVT